MTQETQSTALVTLPKEFAKDFLFDRFKEVEKEVEAHIPDIETVEGRKYIKDLALKINKSKAVLDDPMRAHLKELKALPKVLEENARESKQRFEKLREGVLEPLVKAQEWQVRNLEWLQAVPSMCGYPNIDSEQLKRHLSDIKTISNNEIWPELQKKFKVAIEAATTTATVTLERLEAAEAQAAQLAELQAKQKAADKKEADRLIAEKAAKEATEAAERKAKAEKEAIERRAVEANQREEKAAADAEQAKRDVIEAENKRLQEIKDNKARAEAAAKQAEIDKKAAIEKAAEDERKRLEELAESEKQEAIKRENNKAIRAPINRAAMVAMIAGGMSEEQAKLAITLIAKKQIPNISIFY